MNRYVNIKLEITECTEKGEPSGGDSFSVYLTKRLELSVGQEALSGVIFARQHQVRESIGEERDNGQYIGAAEVATARDGRQAVMRAILDYVRHRLGL